MHARRWIAVGCVLPLILAGCGGGSMAATDPTASAPIPVIGNWVFGVPKGASTTTPDTLPPFLAGSVVTSGAQISADLLAIPLFVTTSASNCALPTTPDVMLTGTVRNAQLSLTSGNWSGTVLTLTGTVGSGGDSITGSWLAKGGCIDGESGSFVGNYVPPMTGTWVGTASNMPAGLMGTSTNSPLAGASITFQLQQPSTPEAYFFPLSGTVTVSGTSCGFTQGTLIGPNTFQPQAGSFIAGDTWTVAAQMNDGKSNLIGAAVPVPGSNTEWLMVFGTSGGACGGVPAEVTLTRQ